MSIGEGQKIGNYRILRRLGVGGMGTVYLAEHPLIGKKVALKVIHRELSSNKEVIARFFNEARSVNKIGNEHIVEIHDFGQSEEGEHFFIMEYLEGRTLAHELEQGVLGVQRGLHIVAQIANGLAAAHTCGIIHRDLKPDNVMLLERLGDRDFVKVLDFGLAKMIHDSGSAKLTAAGVVLGTPQYMSPEACESKPSIDHRSDIYCLGILMFQMLTGRVPFEGNSMGEILVKHVSQAPPAPRAFNPNIPPSVEQIILRCLAKHADSRFPTMKALRDAVLDADAYLASSPPVMPSALVAAAPDQKTMFPTAGMQPGGAVGYAATQALDAAPNDQRAFALRPPPPSTMNASASAKTAFLNAPGGAPPGNTNGTAASAAKTAFMEGPAGGAGAGAAAGGAQSQKTAFMDQVPQVRAPEMPKRTSTAVPDMNQPLPTSNATMMIGTPEGYSDKPPTKKWPIVVALLAVVAVIGGGIAVLMLMGGDGQQSAQAAAAPGDEEAEDVDTAAKVPAMPAKVEPPETSPPPRDPTKVLIELTSSPDGAEIWTDDGELLGTTPKTLPLDKGKKVTLVFKHAGNEATEKMVSTKVDGALHVQLEAKRPEPSSSTSGSRKRPKPGSQTTSKPKPGPKPGDGAGATDTFKPDFEL
ncbi:MAG TPA: protein kinase [Kofleriaceae bacterium]|nr:protein kinase [Kofleriaceae bacterium]